MKYNLKPCPFCGCPPHMDRDEIFCDCGVKFPFPVNEWGCSEENPEGFPTYEQAEKVAVERWNERECDPEPVRHGHWIHCNGKSNLWYCSECGEKIIYNPTRKTYKPEKLPVYAVNKHCRGCGIRMTGE